MEVFITIAASILITFVSIYGLKAYYQQQYETTKHKLTDAELFKLMARANHFLTDKQLASITSLTKQEAKSRLMYLSLEGIIRQFSDGGLHTVYQLIEEVPEDDVLPISIQGLSDEKIIDTVLKYSSDYQITIAELVVIFGISVYEAKGVLKRLKKSGKVTRLWKGVSLIYVVKDPLLQTSPKLKISSLTQPKFNKDLQKTAKLKIPDADVLGLAMEHQGRLTPALVCLKLKIPMNEAQFKLDELHDKGAFIMDVDNINKVVEYHLRDKNLLA